MAWYNASWNYRIKITVDHTKVGASLTNFPVYLDLSTLPAAFFSNVRSDGGDIRMTQSDGTTEVAREIVTIDTTGKTGEVHFNAPTLSNSVDTVFYIYYNNPSATDYATNATYGAQNVWDSNYLAVYHMEGNSNDSTSNGKNGTDTSITYNTSNGKIGKGAGFNGTNSFIDTGITISDLNIDNAHQYSLFLMPQTESYEQTPLYLGNFNIYTPIYNWDGIKVVTGGGSGGYTQYDGTEAISSGTLTSGTFYFLQAVNDGTNIHTYINNVDAGAVGKRTPSVNSASHLFLGKDEASAHFASMSIDELRIQKTNRATGWNSTEYNNLTSAASFYSNAGQETQGVGISHGTLSMMGIGN